MNTKNQVGDTPYPVNSSLLIEEPPLQVLPTLAVAVGLEEAIVVQQLHWYFRNPKNGREINGQRWIFNTYASWKKIFPWWSEITIKRIFIRLEGMHIVESCQPEGGISRRKYYRLNYGMINLMRKGKLSLPSSPFWRIDIGQRLKDELGGLQEHGYAIGIDY